MSTYMPNAQNVERKWVVVDAAGKPLGRVASVVASILRGKNKPIFTPFVDTGDYVIVINASKIVLTGKKMEQKLYRRHSQYPGGLKEIPYGRLLATKPEFVFEQAVRGMLPKNKLGRAMFGKLHVYAGAEHKQQAQKPEDFAL